MFLTGIADEAAPDLAGQIRATRELGWSGFEARGIDGINIHDLPEEKIEAVAEQLDQAGIRIDCFASAIGNWAKKITDPFDISLAEARRAIPRMKRLNVTRIRIMSYAILEDRSPDDQMEEERFRRLRILHNMFADEGLEFLHENCMNYGGMGWTYTMRMVENVPGLRLIFDTGNPVFTEDRSNPKSGKMQSAWEFYAHVRDHIAYVHIKDGRTDPATKKAVFTFPGEGDGDVARIVGDLLDRGYDGGFSIEPHMQQVFHDPGAGSAKPEQLYAGYVEYGRRFERLLQSVREGGGANEAPATRGKGAA